MFQNEKVETAHKLNSVEWHHPIKKSLCHRYFISQPNQHHRGNRPLHHEKSQISSLAPFLAELANLCMLSITELDLCC